MEIAAVRFVSDDRDEVERICAVLLRRRLVACAQISGPIVSSYHWEGEVEAAREWVGVVKTTLGQADAVVDAIGADHHYQLPEVTVAKLSTTAAYGAWVDHEVAVADAN